MVDSTATNTYWLKRKLGLRGQGERPEPKVIADGAAPTHPMQVGTKIVKVYRNQARAKLNDPKYTKKRVSRG